MQLVKRPPDFVIGQPDNPYLRRWWIIPRNRFFNIYLHQILRNDDDRALHDHPWWNVSIILNGGYFEHMPHGVKWRRRFIPIFRHARAAHRLELAFRRPKKFKHPIMLSDLRKNFKNSLALQPCWPLFITGPKIREWGFHCPCGWKHWRDFVGVRDGEAKGDERGEGCGE